VTVEIRHYLAKARRSLDNATQMMGIGLAGPSSRTAYYAIFHAAEAFIFARTGRAAKTHAGVRREFGRLSRDDPAFSTEMTRLLSRAYPFKELDDYVIDPVTDVAMTDAETLLSAARQFVECVEDALSSTPDAPPIT